MFPKLPLHPVAFVPPSLNPSWTHRRRTLATLSQLETECRVALAYPITAAGLLWLVGPLLYPCPCPGLASVYLANARARAFLQLTFWLPTKLSTVTAIARSMSCAEQYSDRRILQNASLMRMMASR